MGAIRRRNQYWKRLGRFCGYPECCIKYFIFKHKTYKDYMEDCVFYNTGFIPCPVCKETVKGFSKEQAIKWLDRDIFNKPIVYPQLNNV